MKIRQLPLGARFRFEGAIYTKTGPLFATGPGGARLIPSYASLEPLEPEAARPANPSADTRALDPARVAAALDAYHRACLDLLPEATRPALEQARHTLLAQLGLNPGLGA